ncbi:alcohol dehydrogenase catalytic domain-containing protein [Streptococcus tangpeifui]|uniref:alcohol dehydrogenase catalytic domain-containing protein n=1 Tax=Streptococcus tangpeifui TaxID=2709400 RepID=UPI0013EA2CD9|nr:MULTISPECIES: alcohol dehydrogenase catalytic domain-containing protein [unclassified Streptococcus]
MKAIVVEKAGGPEVLQLKEVPKPKLRKGWSLIKVKGFGVNRSEIFTRQGYSPSVTFPRILGIEVVGLIEQTTDEKRLPVGQTVVSLMGEMGRDFDGSYAEYVLVPNHQIYPIETRLDWARLAAVPETYYTAFLAMKNLQLKAEDAVLVRGGTSGLGLAFLQLAKAKYPQMTVTATTRVLSKKSQLKKLGFTDIIEDRDGQLQTEQTYSKILELVGPATIMDSLGHLQPFGIVSSVGQLGGKWFLEDFDPIMALQNHKYLSTAYSGLVDEGTVEELFAFIDYYQLDVKPAGIHRLEDLPDIHRQMDDSHNLGKHVVLLEEAQNGTNISI